MLKKVSTLSFFILICLISLSAQSGGSSALIVYFPVTRDRSLTGEVDSLTHASGNTQSMAKIIRDLTGADIFEIDLADPYSASYNTVLMEARDDQKKRARPEIRNRVENINRYDMIFLGYPNWWASIPMPIATFMEQYNLSGKKIIPFCTHGGGRLGQSVSAIAKLSPASEILEPFVVSYGGGRSLERDMEKWLREIGVNVR